jgi:hypothetical protein
MDAARAVPVEKRDLYLQRIAAMLTMSTAAPLWRPATLPTWRGWLLRGLVQLTRPTNLCENLPPDIATGRVTIGGN